jgi:hypothetical protein
MREDNFHRKLESALANYAKVEPRRGLEERVLVNLRAQRERDVTPNWRRWPVVVAGAAVAILAAIALWHGARTTGVTRSVTVTRPQEMVSAPVASTATVLGEINSRSQTPKLKERQMPRTYASAVRMPVGDAPKLDQFPAPEPLSEQEKMLMQYVADDPGEAQLVAEVIALAEQQELNGELNGSEISTGSQANRQ